MPGSASVHGLDKMVITHRLQLTAADYAESDLNLPFGLQEKNLQKSQCCFFRLFKYSAKKKKISVCVIAHKYEF